MNWLVFGEDWQGLVSTTRHLARGLLMEEDQLVWVDSIGMRAPRLNIRDFLRFWRKFTTLLHSSRPLRQQEEPAPRRVVAPHVLPWHRSAFVRTVNRVVFGAQLKKALALLPPGPVHVLAANPVAAYYLGFARGVLVYLRLDDYPLLPGVDAGLAEQSEKLMFGAADLICVTAERLLPQADGPRRKSLYLPQGVDTKHFALLPLTPPAGRTIGFFGLLAEWLDYDLIMEAARLLPAWNFEFIGPQRFVPQGLASVANIRLRPAVSYEDLPQAIMHWDAAWLPFKQNELTAGVNPLKIREYLAAGLPTLAVPLPELQALVHVRFFATAAELPSILSSIVASDSEGERRRRRLSVEDQGWPDRCRTLREKVRLLAARPLAETP